MRGNLQRRIAMTCIVREAAPRALGIGNVLSLRNCVAGVKEEGEVGEGYPLIVLAMKHK